MAEQRPPALFSIPAGVPFARHFAATLLQQNQANPHKLAEIRLFLPTRRACRIVRDEFLRLSEGAALILPRMQALGDLDEDGLGIEIAALSGVESARALPPAMPPLRRKILLARMIGKAWPDYGDHPEQALALAEALGRLLDRIHTEGLDIKNLPDLVDREKFAAHWQITLDFLTIIAQVWPDYLAETGAIDAADRRNRLLHLLADHWQAYPPSGPVYAAGSTGSIPATARLLGVIARLPQGAVILPGLDPDTDAKSWEALDDTHPQATLKTLLHSLGMDRKDVRRWGALPETGSAPPRTLLAREMMRPAATTDRWRDLARSRTLLQQNLAGLERIDCPTAQDEARVISLIFRYVQHNQPLTAALVTFDRDLARRVAAACRRWGLEIDDSAGQPLIATPAGGFIRLTAEACAGKLAPVPLLALLKHSLAGAGMPPADYRGAVRRLDVKPLRGPRPGPGFEGLRARAGETEPALLAALDSALAPFLALDDGQRHPFPAFVAAHLQALEAMAATPEQPGAARLWAGEDGEEAALFFSSLLQNAGEMPLLRMADYPPVLTGLMAGVSVRPRWGTHPRLTILGPLEARLVQADIMILGGLNEGSWPPAAETDPWMSRPMRSRFGLPSPERGIGLSAHDFVQGFCAPRVILTRAERQGTAPTIPARWLQRLDAVLEAAELGLPRTDWLDKAASLDRAAAPIRISRPAPTPPVEKRPVCLSVTEIETWMRDPYALYAKHVLNLKELDLIDESPDAAERGTVIHAALEAFTRTFPESLPEDAYIQLCQIGHNLIDAQIQDPRTRHFWGVRFDKMAEWFVSHEHTWRMQARTGQMEIMGTMTLPESGFTLRGKADRIDVLAEGGAAIIDYKTGTAPSEKEINAGFSPQLPLEAAMLRAGAFPDFPESRVGYMGHWLVGGSRAQGENPVKGDPDDLADAALEGLRGLIERFADPATPYYSLPRPGIRPRHSAYNHLARVQEWAVLDNGNDGSEG